jgi:hypothetical protein
MMKTETNQTARSFRKGKLKQIQLHLFLSQLNSTSTQLKLGVTKYLVGPPPPPPQTTPPHPPPPVKLLRHFQTTQEADFRYATLF